jgi:hypothetical protein
MPDKRKRGAQPRADRPALQDEIVDWVSEGKPLSQWCALPGKVNRVTVHRWAHEHDDFAQRLARARDIGCDVIAEETVRLSETKPLTYVDQTGSERIDPGAVQWHRLQVDTRLKLLACWNPSRYGQRQAVEHSGGVQLTVVTGVPDA